MSIFSGTLVKKAWVLLPSWQTSHLHLENLMADFSTMLYMGKTDNILNSGKRRAFNYFLSAGYDALHQFLHGWYTVDNTCCK